jgi:hypothetical protein
VEVLWEAAVGVCVYEWNDLLLRVRDADGEHLDAVGGDGAWATVLAASESRPLFLQVRWLHLTCPGMIPGEAPPLCLRILSHLDMIVTRPEELTRRGFVSLAL